MIGGKWGDAAGGKRFATLNPATEDVIAEVSEAGAADIDAAVSAARRALKQGAWAAMSGAERGRILNRLAAILRERTEELVQLESIDGGKPFAATRRMDIPAAIDCLEYYAGWADKIAGEVIPARRDALTYTQRVPVGVVAVIVPWNFALMNAVWKIAPALACGCTIVMKPSELTPLSALWLGAAALEAGLPPGVLTTRFPSLARRRPDSSSCARRPKTSQGLVSNSAANRQALSLPTPISNRPSGRRPPARSSTPGKSAPLRPGSLSIAGFTTPSSISLPPAPAACGSAIPASLTSISVR
jgi:hypothetical protein